MPLRKKHKKDFTPKMKDEIGDTLHHGKLPTDKVKYKHKSHWLEENDDEDLPVKMKAKKKKS